MEPPKQVCRALAEMHPQLRLAWEGKPRQSEDDLNAGNFAIVQLFHRRDCGTPDLPLTFREFWEVGPVMDDSGEVSLGRVTRGPIFSKKGTHTPDWDPKVRSPILIVALNEEFAYPWGEPLKTEDVYSGKFLLAVDAWLHPFFQRVRTARERAAREWLGKTKDEGREYGNSLWRHAMQADQETVIAPWKHIRGDVHKFMAKHEKAQEHAADLFQVNHVPTK